MLRSPAFTLGCDLKEGDEGSLETELANELISRGIAEPVAALPEAKPKQLKAVPPNPSIAEAKESEIKE